MVDTASADKTPKGLQRAAEAGDVEAQYELGMMYEHGLGMPKDLQAAVFWYRTAGENGNGTAQYKLFGMYESGHGVTASADNAVQWLRKAAESGLPEAQFKLGLCLEQGRSVTQKHSEAATWYMSAAQQGSIEAQYRLGLLYEAGLGVARDCAAAAKYYAQAAERGNGNAQYALGVLYVTGEGVQKDLKLAASLFESAAAQGNARAKQKITEVQDMIITRGHARPKSREEQLAEMKQKQLEEDQKHSSLWAATWPIVRIVLIPATPSGLFVLLVRFTPLGHFISDMTAKYKPFMIGIAAICALVGVLMIMSFFKKKQKKDWFPVIIGSACISVAIGIAIYICDPEKQIDDPSLRQAKGAAGTAVERELKSHQGPTEIEMTNSKLLKGATKGDPKSQAKLAARYEAGYGLDRDRKRALELYQKAAKKNNEFATCRLAMMYKEGVKDKDQVVLEADQDETLKLLKKAAKQEYGPAFYQLGLIYQLGDGVKADLKAAKKWYEDGANLGDAHCQYKLAMVIMENNPADPDKVKLVDLLRQAAKQEMVPAAQKLVELYDAGWTQVTKWAATAPKEWKKIVEIAGVKQFSPIPDTEEWMYQQADENIMKPEDREKKKEAKNGKGGKDATKDAAKDGKDAKAGDGKGAPSGESKQNESTKEDQTSDAAPAQGKSGAAR